MLVACPEPHRICVALTAGAPVILPTKKNYCEYWHNTNFTVLKTQLLTRDYKQFISSCPSQFLGNGLPLRQRQAIMWINVHIVVLNELNSLLRVATRTTRTPASWLPILLSNIGSKVKRRPSQSYKFKEFAKISNFLILIQTLHATHLLKMLDKMCKYDPPSIVEDTERKRFCPQTDRRTKWNQYTPLSTSLKRGV